MAEILIRPEASDDLAAIRAALDACRRADHEVVVVLGHPEYY